jgi:prepilin-type N-terminal cleavage/methylation domain-containing protein/prepilin-type processing-associated H-X9-DG protein
MPARSPRQGFTLVELLVVIVIIALLIGLLLAAVQRIRDAANRTTCGNNLRQIALAFHHYHSVHGYFPPGVSYRGGADPYPFMSWNARLLPFLEQDNLWGQALQAFAMDKLFLNNPPHTGLATVMPVYACPSDSRGSVSQRVTDQLEVAFTFYLGASGSNQFRKDGVLYLDSRVRLADVTDGSSNTLLAGERPPSPEGRFGWWYAGEGQDQTGSADMVLSAGERNTSAYVPACPEGPYSFGPGQLQNPCDTFHFWSLHRGGANFLFADGSVHFLPYSAAPILPALATRAGGEAIEIP